MLQSFLQQIRSLQNRQTVKQRRRHRLLRGRHRQIAASESVLEDRILLAAPSENNILVTQEVDIGENRIFEYTTTGQLVQTFEIEFGSENGEYPNTEYIRDVSMDPDGNIQIYNGTFEPWQTEFDPVAGTFVHRAADDFSTANNVSYGGITVFGDYVYATNMDTAGSDVSGLVRFDRTDNSSTAFLTDEEYVDVELGLNGNLYAVRQDNTTLDVVNPSTAAVIDTIEMSKRVRHVTATTDNRLFAVSWEDDAIFELDAAGAVVKELGLSSNPMDLDIRSDGTIVIGGSGEVYITDVSLASVTEFEPVDDSHTFVSFVRTAPALSVGDVTVDENAGAAVLTINVGGFNPTPITVTYETDEGTATSPEDYEHTSGSITIPAFTTTAEIEVSLVNDETDEPAETFDFYIGSNDVTVADNVATVTIEDNDESSTLSVGNVTVEEGGTAVVVWELNRASGFDIEFDYATMEASADEADYEAKSGTVTIPAGETSASVGVTTINDEMDEDTEVFVVTTSEPVNVQIDDGEAEVIIEDNDGPPTLMFESVEVNEADGSAVVEFTLAQASGRVITVQVISADDSAVAPGDYAAVERTLEFSPGSTSAVIEVEIINDNLVEETEAFALELLEPVNVELPEGIPMVYILDDDEPGIVVSETNDSTIVGEDGSTDMVQISLTAQPQSDVIINLSSETDEFTYLPSQVTITADAWNTPQMVTIVGEDDDVADGNQTDTLVFRTDVASDPRFVEVPPVEVEVTVEDDDPATLVVTESDGSTQVSENGDGDSVFVSLSSEPTADVVVHFAGDGVDAGVSSITIAISGWNIPQEIFLGVADNEYADGTTAGLLTIETDEAAPGPYANQAVSVDVEILDDDSAELVVSESDGSTLVGESGTMDTISVALSARPRGEVIVEIPEVEGLQHSPGVITLTGDNWNSPQIVEVTATDNGQIDGDRTANMLFNVSSESVAPFDGAAAVEVSVTIVDDDTAGVVVELLNDNLNIGEDAAKQIAISLTAQPVGPVTIQVASEDTSQIVVEGAELTFDSESWNMPQTVDVAAVDDTIVDGSQSTTINIAVIAAPDDDAFTAIDPTQLTAMSIDNDVPGLQVTETDGSTDVFDDGTTGDTVFVSLTAGPLTPVVILPESRNGDRLMSADALTFTPENWAEPQEVSVQGVADDTVNGDQSVVMAFGVVAAESDDAFSNLSPQAVDVLVQNDDTAGFEISATSFELKEGESTEFDVVLTAAPASDVVIDVTSDNADEASVDATSLTFDNGNWNDPQTVTIMAVDDELRDGTTEAVISAAVSATSDPFFRTLDDQSVAVTVTDNEPEFTADIDGDEEYQPLTDGILTLRYLAGFTGEPLVSNAVNENGPRTEPEEITAWLNDFRDQLDIDGDGQTQPLTDGILFLRYLAGFRGDILTSMAVSENATRTTAEIEAYMESLLFESSSGGGGGAAAMMASENSSAIDELFRSSDRGEQQLAAETDGTTGATAFESTNETESGSTSVSSSDHDNLAHSVGGARNGENHWLSLFDELDSLHD